METVDIWNWPCSVLGVTPLVLSTSPYAGSQCRSNRQEIIDLPLFLGQDWQSYMEGSLNAGTPAGWFWMKHPKKMDDLGVPPWIGNLRIETCWKCTTNLMHFQVWILYYTPFPPVSKLFSRTATNSNWTLATGFLLTPQIPVQKLLTKT